MSISPTIQEEQIGVNPLQRARIVGAKSAHNFLGDPLHYILILGLIGLIVGLLLGRRFPVELYILMVFVAAGVIAKFLYKEKQKKNNQK
jgi:hypothetical protein